MKRLALVFAWLYPASFSWAATLYLAPGGSDANNCLSEAAPCKTFRYVLENRTPPLAAGDTLILLDGTYLASVNGTVNDDARDQGTCPNCSRLPSGSSLAAATVLKAKNPFQATIRWDGPAAGAALFLGRSARKDSYIRIEGIVFDGGQGSGGTLYNTRFITLKNCGFHSARDNGGSYIFGIGTNDHNEGNDDNLVEDVFIWGSSQKASGPYRAKNNIWRRVFIRHDGCDPTLGSDPCNSGKWPASGSSVYNSVNNYYENVIQVDGKLYPGNFAGPDFSHSQADNTQWSEPAAGPNYWLGCLSLNSDRDCAYFEVGRGATPVTEVVRDFVCWGAGGMSAQPKAEHGQAQYKNITTRRFFRCRDIPGSLQDSIALDSSAASSCINTNLFSAVTNIDVFNCSPAYQDNTCSGPNCYMSDPRNDGPIPSLKYLPRIESGSFLADKGSDGGPVGATLVAYGASGTRFGENGFDARLDLSHLWPWPNEATIKEKICADTKRPDYGLCAPAQKGKTISQYIWEYLGQPCPAEICPGGGVENTPPAANTPAASTNNGARAPSASGGCNAGDPVGGSAGVALILLAWLRRRS